MYPDRYFIVSLGPAAGRFLGLVKADLSGYNLKQRNPDPPGTGKNRQFFPRNIRTFKGHQFSSGSKRMRAIHLREIFSAKISSLFAFHALLRRVFPLILLILFAADAFPRSRLRCVRHSGGLWITHVAGNAALAKKLGVRAADPLRATASVRLSCLRNVEAGDTTLDTLYFMPVKQGGDTAVLVFAARAPGSPDSMVVTGRCELSTGVAVSLRKPHTFSFVAQVAQNKLVFFYGLPAACRVDIEIFDALGRAAGAPVKDDVQEMRYYQREWATNGRQKGVYFCKFTAIPSQGQTSVFMRTQRVVIR
jgi:hypothetical protein